MKKIMSAEEADKLAQQITGLSITDIEKAIKQTEERTGKRPAVIGIPRISFFGIPCEFYDMPHGTIGCFVPDEIPNPTSEERH